MHNLYIDFYNSKISLNSSHYIIIVFSLNNNLDLTINNKTFNLSLHDIYIINPNNEIEIKTNDDYVLISIDYYFLLSQFNNRNYQFDCNSSQSHNDSFASFRNLLLQIILTERESDDFKYVTKNKLMYELLLFIVHNYGIYYQNQEEDNIHLKFKSYIYLNYKNDITLKEISLHFGMTPQYFSKLFKETMKMTFLKYLRQIQLEYTLLDLEHNLTNNILSTALDNGFPNVNSFYNTMQEIYNCSIEEYLSHKKTKTQYTLKDNLNIQIVPQMENNQQLVVDCKKYYPFKAYWKEILNLVQTTNLNDSFAQEQLANLQQELHFNYARILLWYQMDDNALDINSFFYEERILDYLLSLDFKIWFVLDLRMIKNQDYVLTYFKNLLSHFSNRYSIENIRLWKIELIYNTIFDDIKINYYQAFYQKLKQMLMIFKCENNLLGPGLLISNLENIDYFTNNLKDINCYSFISDPYRLIDNADYKIINRSKDVGFLKNCINSLRQQTRNQNILNGMYITEWNDTIARYNVINDSCYKGALIIKTIIDTFNQLDGLACVNPLDIVDQKAQLPQCLFGYRGLISKHGIKKPAFYAYSFFNRLPKYYLTKDNNSLVMHNGANNYQIICHNCKTLNYKYFLQESVNEYQNLNNLFEDLNDIELSYSIVNVKNGTYVCKIRSISSQYGSVQDLVADMVDDLNIPLSSSEIEYLKRLSTPRERLEIIKVNDNTLNLKVKLIANEFCYLHLIYQY